VSGRFEGKVALIAGGAHASKGDLMGFGGIAAWEILKGGGKVVIGDLDDDAGEKSVQQMRDDGFEAHYVHLDVTDEAQWASAVSKVISEFGSLSIMVNLAGTLDRDSIEGVDIDTWRLTMEVTNMGMFLGVRAVAPSMREAGGGSIVLISSMAAKLASDYGSAYATSRAGMTHFARSAAVQLGPDNIRVNTVLPGWTITPFTAALLEDKKATEWRNNRVPLRRWANADEIANGILFLASDEASYVSGSELLMDGGTTAWWGPGPD